MRTRRAATSTDLRLAVDSLPRHTRIAMLDAITTDEIIVGAYSSTDGVCPMLAAHRAGGRANVIAFARAWDRFAFRDSRSGRARRATERELLVLRVALEASLLSDDAPDCDLAAARRDHLELVQRAEGERPVADVTGLAERRPRPGEPDRRAELDQRPGWAWTRVVRRYDEYERVLARLESERAAVQPQPAQPLLTR